jgi:hypothetical protein
MNGSNVIAAAVLGQPGMAWQVVGTGDFNGDGKADLVFQNSSTGEVAEWLLNGVQILGGYSLGNPGTAWHIV